eukprot:GGOE01020117.1.p1 GENE.GGOE01020117.1~~GGOE01020117.1.p1  ORF type:complete len:419 (-),score=36.36 GGOE01020117.1:174-1430(-)
MSLPSKEFPFTSENWPCSFCADKWHQPLIEPVVPTHSLEDTAASSENANIEDDVTSSTVSTQGQPMGRKLRPNRRRRFLEFACIIVVTTILGATMWWAWFPGAHPAGPGSFGRIGESQQAKQGENLRQRPFLPATQIEADCQTILTAGPRVGGSGSHGFNVTQSLITGRLQQLGWAVSLDSFTTRTVLGPKTFHNIIAMGPSEAPVLNAPTLLLAAHYDSKLFTAFEFVGATDSAASCAMLLDIAANLTISPPQQQIVLVFFDGEEAFQEWTATDSIYGARHLAGKWEKDGTLGKIGLFVLLDLLGDPSSTLRGLSMDTHSEYLWLPAIETGLRQRGLLHRPHPHFMAELRAALIEDDHLPFLRRGVPVVHLIPIPFPHVWHTARDNLDALSFSTIYDLTLVLTEFARQYFPRRQKLQ